MTRVTLEIKLPDELLQPLLQHVRDFDTKYDPEHESLIHLAIGVEAPEIPAATIQGIFRSIRPPFENEYVLQGRGEA
jgi:hypothetical protein